MYNVTSGFILKAHDHISISLLISNTTKIFENVPITSEKDRIYLRILIGWFFGVFSDGN